MASGQEEGNIHFVDPVIRTVDYCLSNVEIDKYGYGSGYRLSSMQRTRLSLFGDDLGLKNEIMRD
jgi:hypothetical protein